MIINYKKYILLVISIYLTSCNVEETSDTLVSDVLVSNNSPSLSKAIPNQTKLRSELDFNRTTSIWKFGEEIYSGFAVSYYSNNQIKEKIGILNGKKEGLEIRYFKDGHEKGISEYKNGKLNGAKKSWSQDSPHILLSHLNYKSGKLNGEQKKWYYSGELHKILNLNMGKEDGIQKAFRKNGVQYANYEAKNGRIFGLKKAKLCYGLEEEKLQAVSKY